MAQYCRYCGEKMERPKDRFCYKCRREGLAVDGFYRKIPEEDKIPLTEDEQDILRGAGDETMLCALIILLLTLSFIILGVVFLLYGLDEQYPIGVWIALIAIFAVSVKMFILGRQMFMLKRKPCGKKLNIFLYKEFFVITHINYNNIRHKKALCWAVLDTMEKFALGEDGLPPEPKPSEEQKKAAEKNWKCGFCGYVNTYSSYSCKSCGKERIKERR